MKKESFSIVLMLFSCCVINWQNDQRICIDLHRFLIFKISHTWIIISDDEFVCRYFGCDNQ